MARGRGAGARPRPHHLPGRLSQAGARPHGPIRAHARAAGRRAQWHPPACRRRRREEAVIAVLGQAQPLQLPHVDWVTIAPEGIFFVGGLLLLIAGVFTRRRAPRGLWSVCTVAIALLALWPTFH